MLAAALAFLTQLTLARQLSPASYGVLANALALTTLLAPFAGFGLQGFWLKAFGQEGWQARRWLPASYRFLVMNALVVLCLFGAWAALGPHDGATRKTLLQMTPAIFGLASIELTASKFQLEDRYSRLSLWQLMPNLCRMLLILACAHNLGEAMSPSDIAGIYSLVALAVVLITVVQMRRMSSAAFDLHGHGVAPVSIGFAQCPSVGEVARQSWPFGLAGVFYLIYYQSSIVLLKYLASDELAGVYSVAFNVMNAVYLLPIVLYQKFLLGKMHRWASQDKPRLLSSMKSGSILMLAAGVTMSVSLWVAAPALVTTMFGQKYAEAAELLKILAFCVPFRFLSTSIGAVLVTSENMRYRVKLMGISAAINLLVSVTLIPAYGARGAALATLATELSLLAMFGWGVFARRERIFHARGLECHVS